MYYIGIEDLAANAFIENPDLDFISYEKLEEYGRAVVDHLNKREEKACLVLSRDDTTKMLNRYSPFFKEKKVGKSLGISLVNKEDTPLTLIEKFRGYLALGVLLAFMDEETRKVLISE